MTTVQVTHRSVEFEVEGDYEAPEPSWNGGNPSFIAEKVYVGGQDVYHLLSPKDRAQIEEAALQVCERRSYA